MRQKQEKPAVYCQNCSAANNLREPFCTSCGTRLMIVVFPESLQYDTNAVPSYYEDHLLERVSLLELRLVQVMDKLEKAYEFIENGFDSFKKDRLILHSFLETVHELNPDLASAVSRRSLEKFTEIKNNQKAKKRHSEVLEEILTNHSNPNNEVFGRLVREGMKLLARQEEKEAFQMLERASLLSPRNIPLHLFNAVNLFRAEKKSEAKKYLDKILKIEPLDAKARLFLAAVEVDDGEISKARKLLKDAGEDHKNASPEKLIKAFLEAFEENWKKSAEYLKQVYKRHQTAEIAYLLGCVYFQLNLDDKALKFLEKAVLNDVEFADAWLMQAVIHQKHQNHELENFSLDKAAKGSQNASQAVEYLKGRKSLEIKTALPFMHFKTKKSAVITGGSLRIASFFRELLLNSIED